MFFKRLLGNEPAASETQPPSAGLSAGSTANSATSPSLPAGVQLMNADLQRKLNSRTIQYNMKVVIRGDRSVGKTSLFRRIQGLDFQEDYNATEEIQAAHISWTYKTSDDTVKVEVWDVVDKGKPKQKLDSLKLSNEVKQLYSNASLDAEFIDVYKGAHCVIFVFDITKLWTYEYVEREIVKVPPNLPVLILANRADQSHHRTVPKDRSRVFAETYMHSRPAAGGAPVMACEASMRNNYGLRFVHAFLGIPFLVMQRNTLISMLERNAGEIEVMHDELTAMLDDPSQSYEAFSDAMANKRREKADSLSPAVALAAKGAIAPTPPPQPAAPQEPQVPTAAQVIEQLVPDQLKPILGVPNNSAPPPPAPKIPTQVAMTGVGGGQPIVVPGAVIQPSFHKTTVPPPQQQSAPPPPAQTTPASSSSLFSKVFQPKQPPQQAANARPPSAGPIGSVDEFVPGLDVANADDDWLSDELPKSQQQQQPKKGGFMSMFSKQQAPPPPAPAPAPQPPKPAVVKPVAKPKPIDSDEDEDGRPQIAGFSEEVDFDDLAVGSIPAGNKTSDSESDVDLNASRKPIVTSSSPKPPAINNTLEEYDCGEVPLGGEPYEFNDEDFASASTTALAASQIVSPTPAPFQHSLSPRSSRTSSVQQPPSPPPFDGTNQRSFSVASYQQQVSESDRSRSNSYNIPVQTAIPAQIPSPIASSNRSSSASLNATPQVVLPDQKSPSLSPSPSPAQQPSSNRSSNATPQHVLADPQEIWDEEEEQHEKPAEPESALSSETPSINSNAAVAAVQQQTASLQLSDLDFAFLEQKTARSSSIIDQTDNVSTTSSASRPKKSTKKKTTSKKAVSVEETEEVKPKKKTTKKVVATGEAAPKKVTKKTTKPVVQERESSGDEEPAAPVKTISATKLPPKAAALKVSASPAVEAAPVKAKPITPEMNDEDDLESFLNS